MMYVKKEQKIAAVAPIETLSHHVPYGTKEKPQKNLREGSLSTRSESNRVLP
jgi:hypothetical protein